MPWASEIKQNASSGDNVDDAGVSSKIVSNKKLPLISSMSLPQKAVKYFFSFKIIFDIILTSTYFNKFF